MGKSFIVLAAWNLWQLYYAIDAGKEQKSPEQFIVNMGESCRGEYIRSLSSRRYLRCDQFTKAVPEKLQEVADSSGHVRRQSQSKLEIC
jgi:hypothetical protein